MSRGYELIVKQTSADDFLGIEDGIAEALLLTAGALATSAGLVSLFSGELARSIDGGVSPLIAAEDAIARAEGVWKGSVWTPDLERSVTAKVASVVDAGEAVVAAGAIANSASRLSVINGMVRSMKYYTNEYFSTQIAPAVVAEVDKVLTLGGPISSLNFAPIRDLVDKHFKSVRYWKLVANAAANRGYNYGVLKAAQTRGARFYQIVAVIDKRTSKTCLDLNGQQFPIEVGIDVVERIAASEDVAEAKNISPWLNYSELRELSEQEIIEKGVVIPPFHGNCRTTVQPS